MAKPVLPPLDRDEVLKMFKAEPSPFYKLPDDITPRDLNTQRQAPPSAKPGT